MREQANSKKARFLAGSDRSALESSDSSGEDIEPQKPDIRLQKMRENVSEIVYNSTILPFRWLATCYRCFYCYDVFQNPSELVAHSLLHEKQEIRVTMQKYWENDVYVNVVDMFCSVCLKEHSDLDDLIDHLISAHDVPYDKDTTHCFKPFRLNDDVVICAECGDGFESFNQLLLHVTKAHKNPEDHLCNDCGRTFKKHQIKHHIHNEHRSKMVICTQCGERISANSRRTHMARVHNKKMKCRMCKEQFSTHYLKQRHMTEVHKSRKEFRCPECPNVFYFKSTLNRHMKEVHLKERDFMCTICGWRGHLESRLKAHMLTHGCQAESKIPCIACNRMFKNEKNMLQHYQTAHDNDDQLIIVEENELII